MLLKEDDQRIPVNFALEIFKRAYIDIKSGQGHAYVDIDVTFNEVSKFLALRLMNA